MKEIPKAELQERVSAAGLMLESLSEGTIRISLSPSSPPRDIHVEAIPPAAPPVFVTAYRESRSVDRFAVVDSRSELEAFISTALANASSVADDVYIFPSSGNFMLYVSHHDALTIWEKPNNTSEHIP